MSNNTFFFNSDVVLHTNDFTQHGLRSFGFVSFDPTVMLEINTTISDALLTLVMCIRDTYDIRLYLCAYPGSDYIQLAHYTDLFKDEFMSVYDGLVSYNATGDITRETMGELVSIYNRAMIFLNGKINMLKSDL